MIELWPFQGNLIGDLRMAIRAGFKAPLMVSPTGSGKTVMFAYLVSKLAHNGKRTVILAHRKELLDQISDTLKDFRVSHDLIEPGRNYNSNPLTHVASVFSVVRRLHGIIVPDYAIIDEAHHAAQGSTWNKVIGHWRKLNPKLIVFGVTATPQRLSGEGLDVSFDTMVMGPTVAELIKDGYLAPYKMFAPPRPVDMSGVKRNMGDFSKAESAAIMEKPSIMGDAINHYRKHLNGAPTIGFCVSIEHAHHMAETYKANGFQAASIDGKLSRKDRNQINKDFSRGALNYMASCDLVSEGYDVKGAVGCQNLRPTESLSMCLQQWGRVLRFVPGKTAIILDHVGNSARHGLPDTKREWSLQGTPKGDKKQRDPDDIQIKQCKACGAVCAMYHSNCPECGTEFKIKARKVDEVEGTLEEILEHEKETYLASVEGVKRLKYLAGVGKLRGYKNPEGWAAHVLGAVKKKEFKNRRRANG